jgi:hypothetical protein
MPSSFGHSAQGDDRSENVPKKIEQSSRLAAHGNVETPNLKAFYLWRGGN